MCGNECGQTQSGNPLCPGRDLNIFDTFRCWSTFLLPVEGILRQAALEDHPDPHDPAGQGHQGDQPDRVVPLVQGLRPSPGHKERKCERTEDVQHHGSRHRRQKKCHALPPPQPEPFPHRQRDHQRGLQRPQPTARLIDTDRTLSQLNHPPVHFIENPEQKENFPHNRGDDEGKFSD